MTNRIAGRVTDEAHPAAYRMQCRDGEICRRNCTFDGPCERASPGVQEVGRG